MKLKLPPLTSLALVLLVTLQGCLNNRDSPEQIFKEHLAQHKSDHVLSIDLLMIFGDQWEKVCLQSPYMHRGDFERISGKNVPDFRAILDDRYVFWVLYRNGLAIPIEIERINVMDYVEIGTKCTSFQNPYLYFKIVGGEKRYFLNDIGVQK